MAAVKTDVLVRFTVTHDPDLLVDPLLHGGPLQLVQGLCEVGGEFPGEEYPSIEDLSFEILNGRQPELDSALEDLEGFTPEQRTDFYDRLSIVARSIAEHIAEEARQAGEGEA